MNFTVLYRNRAGRNFTTVVSGDNKAKALTAAMKKLRGRFSKILRVTGGRASRVGSNGARMAGGMAGAALGGRRGGAAAWPGRRSGRRA